MSEAVMVANWQQVGLRDEEQLYLRRLPLFHGLSEDQLWKLLSKARVRQVPSDCVLFLEGEPADRFFIILGGWIKLHRDSELGHESIIAILSQGESFAEAAIFAGGDFPVTATAVEASRLLSIPANSFVEELRGNNDVALNLLASMSGHLRRLVGEIESLAARSAIERVTGFLLKLAPQEAGEARIVLPFDKSLVALRLGMTPETFSRTLSRLKSLEVKVKGSEIVIPDVKRLRNQVMLNKGQALHQSCGS